MKRTLIILFFLFECTQVQAQSSLKDKFEEFINTWIKVPYVFGGDTNRGIDCSALTQRAYKFLFNLEIPRTAYYQFKSLTILPKDSIQSGDLIFFKSALSPSGWHVGMYLWDGKFLHAANRKEGVKISCIDDSYYQDKIRGIGRRKL